MRRTINKIQDMELIEKELQDTAIGVFALVFDDDKLTQYPTTFLYRDKNIYIFCENDSELYQSVKYNSNASFSIVKQVKIKREEKIDFTPSYQMFSITLNGLVRKVEEEKMMVTLRQEYLAKYSKKTKTLEKKLSALEGAIIMDSNEIHAQEELGG